jgi:hypothetical protein
MKTRTVCLTVLTLALMLSLGASAQAQKVKMPREGAFELDYCWAGKMTTPIATKELTILHYSIPGNLKAIPPGGPFDQQSMTCWGTWVNVGGKAEEMGACEAVDQDGDKWYVTYNGNPDGASGTFSAVYGTAKYGGMAMDGQYVVKLWPMTGDIGHACNPLKGTYKLAQ